MIEQNVDRSATLHRSDYSTNQKCTARNFFIDSAFATAAMATLERQSISSFLSILISRCYNMDKSFEGHDLLICHLQT